MGGGARLASEAWCVGEILSVTEDDSRNVLRCNFNNLEQLRRQVSR